MLDDVPLRQLAAEQHGVVGVSQAADLGFGEAQRRRLIDGRRWERLGPRTLGLIGVPRTAAHRAMTAVVSAGHGGALCATSAGSWWGIPGNQLEPFHVTRYRDRSVVAPVGGRAHQPLMLPSHHVVRLDGVPTVVPARALLEIAGSRRGGARNEAWVARMARMVDTAWSLRLVSGRSLHAMFEEMAARGRSGVAVMRLVLADRGVDYVPPASGLESRLQQILERAGVPPLRRQVDSGGDRWIGRVDFRDAVLPFILEVQSERFHASLVDRQLDHDRLSSLRASGFEVREVTDVDVWTRPRHVVETVAAGRAAASRRAA